jgi:hypothetical protein
MNTGGRIIDEETLFKPTGGKPHLDAGTPFIAALLETAPNGFAVRVSDGVVTTPRAPWLGDKKERAEYTFDNQKAAEDKFRKILQDARDEGFWLSRHNVMPSPGE